MQGEGGYCLGLFDTSASRLREGAQNPSHQLPTVNVGPLKIRGISQGSKVHFPQVKKTLYPSAPIEEIVLTISGNSKMLRLGDYCSDRRCIKSDIYIYPGLLVGKKIVTHANAETGSTMHLEVARRVKVLVTN